MQAEVLNNPAIPKDAKVWIYQSNRLLNEYEVVSLKGRLNDFLHNWQAHGKQLKVAGDVLHNLFIVLAVDESVENASGCSIDSSVNFIRQLGNELNTDFFDRFAIAYQEGEEIKVCKKEEFEQLVKAGKVTPDTIVYNNLVQDYEGLGNQWKVPVSESWHAKIFF